MLMIACCDHYSIQLWHHQQLFGVLELLHVAAKAPLTVGSRAFAVVRPDIAHCHHSQILFLLAHFHHVPMAAVTSATTEKCQIETFVSAVDSRIRESTHGSGGASQICRGHSEEAAPIYPGLHRMSSCPVSCSLAFHSAGGH